MKIRHLVIGPHFGYEILEDICNSQAAEGYELVRCVEVESRVDPALVLVFTSPEETIVLDPNFAKFLDAPQGTVGDEGTAVKSRPRCGFIYQAGQCILHTGHQGECLPAAYPEEQ